MRSLTARILPKSAELKVLNIQKSFLENQENLVAIFGDFHCMLVFLKFILF